MPQKKLSEIVMELLNREGKPFMTVKNLAVHMTADQKRSLGIFGLTSATEIRRAIEPELEDKFMFNKKGNVLYILVPCQPEDLVLAELSAVKGKSPKAIGRLVPFTKKDCAQIFQELESEGRIKIILNETLETRIFLADPSEQRAANVISDENKNVKQTYNFETFKYAFQALDNGRIFVRICDLRKKLQWPREVFDDVLRNLRDEGIIQLHVGDASLMTAEEVNDCFVDENHFRMGTVTWHGK